MQLIINDFDVEKTLPSVIAIKCAESYLYELKHLISFCLNFL